MPNPLENAPSLGSQDSHTWKAGKSSSLSVKSCYNLLLQVPEEATSPKRLWKNKTPLKVMCSTWIDAQSLLHPKEKGVEGIHILLQRLPV